MEMTLAPELEGLPEDLQDFIARLDEFIEHEIKPLEAENIQFFDHRREWARTDFENDGVHRREWLDLLDEMRRRADAILGEEGRGLDTALFFVHENRIRQAASGVGAADYCVRESVRYARERVTFGKPLAERQAIQWPLVELATDVQLLRTFVRKTASEMDGGGSRVTGISDKVSMCNFRANRLVCEAADRAMQVHGGVGYTRHKPFEHIYRHHRRYRITEGSEEIQIRNVAGHLFGFMKR